MTIAFRNFLYSWFFFYFLKNDLLCPKLPHFFWSRVRCKLSFLDFYPHWYFQVEITIPTWNSQQSIIKANSPVSNPFKLNYYLLPKLDYCSSFVAYHWLRVHVNVIVESIVESDRHSGIWRFAVRPETRTCRSAVEAWDGFPTNSPAQNLIWLLPTVARTKTHGAVTILITLTRRRQRWTTTR